MQEEIKGSEEVFFSRLFVEESEGGKITTSTKASSGGSNPGSTAKNGTTNPESTSKTNTTAIASGAKNNTTVDPAVGKKT